jgi:hypothetical protein
MTFSAVRCPHCDSAPIVTRGKTHRGTPRYLGQHTACARGSVLLDDRNRGCVPEVRPQFIAMRGKARGVRDTARVLRIRTATVLRELPPQRTLPCLWSALATPRWTKWGVVWARQRHSGGCGLPWITAREPSWRMLWAAAKTKFGGGGKRCSSRLGSRATLQRMGARTRVIAMLKSPLRASATRRKSSANIGRGGRG